MKERIGLITGASSGIGAATARWLARQGMRVVLTARRQDRLEALAQEIRALGGTALAIPADLADPSARQRLVRQIEETWGPVEVLINNAGFGYYATVEETPWDVVERMFAVNILAMIHLVQLVLPGMRRLGRGHIINIASVAGYISTPPLTVYSATKFAVVGFSEGLRRELEPHGIHVTVISPGPVRTEFGRVASGLAVDPGEVPGGLNPEAVARAIARALRRPVREIVIPARYRPAIWINQALPRLVDWGAARQGRAWLRHLEKARGEEEAPKD
ncbi:SDR family oxidoreductase [Thermoflexus sp.]|uniref:SDR family NAD(P)-dependent oxidoreductase n=1 Tax=Thermoflexus sp. TaxID=1969742 RepID=UPI0025FDA8D0|nr:SDR family oxidoreductase [Thermoflexus sp.]MDW8180108.1 SDR family oxidoreductase [Anaerolineae bacterium]MCS6964251.1 SDR family oxidoreductase [Thermoflexus sp.]MCS7350657.1 SDR family oxidoreductase [Thermoflexus sp.]MCX7690665.1 SDR family oxidoreductase [Thermoflexus sp.]MDW8185802.1 SDR family oxidoreductase [Anaerolineae bacterium]